MYVYRLKTLKTIGTVGEEILETVHTPSGHLLFRLSNKIRCFIIKRPSIVCAPSAGDSSHMCSLHVLCWFIVSYHAAGTTCTIPESVFMYDMKRCFTPYITDLFRNSHWPSPRMPRIGYLILAGTFPCLVPRIMTQTAIWTPNLSHPKTSSSLALICDTTVSPVHSSDIPQLFP